MLSAPVLSSTNTCDVTYRSCGRILRLSLAVLARKPTIIALYGQRRSTIWCEQCNDSALWQYMAERRVQYIAQERYGVFDKKQDQNARLNTFLRSNASELVPVFTNEWFVLYRVQSTARSYLAGDTRKLD